jgi:hypothetical protein
MDAWANAAFCDPKRKSFSISSFGANDRFILTERQRQVLFKSAVHDDVCIVRTYDRAPRFVNQLQVDGDNIYGQSAPRLGVKNSLTPTFCNTVHPLNNRD